MKTYTVGLWRWYELEVPNDAEAERVARAVAAALANCAGTHSWRTLELDTDVRRGRSGKVLWEESKAKEEAA